jgi:hypothetical protein
MAQHDGEPNSYDLIEIDGVVVGLVPCFRSEEGARLTSHMHELQNMIEALKLLEHLGGDTKGPAAAFVTWKSRMQEELDAIRGRRDAIYLVEDSQPLEGDNGQVRDDNDARLTGFANDVEDQRQRRIRAEGLYYWTGVFNLCLLWAAMRFVAPHLGDWQTYAIWAMLALSVFGLAQYDDVDLRPGL